MSESGHSENVELRCNVDKALLGVCIEVPSGVIVLMCRRCKKKRYFKFPRRKRQEPTSKLLSSEEPAEGKRVQ